MRRRQFVLATAASCATVRVAQASTPPLQVGFIYPGPTAEVGWSHQHELGRRMLERELGTQVRTRFVEKVPEGPDAERVLRQLIADGCQMLFTTSFGYMEPTVRVARDHPEVVFEHCSGYKTAANVGVYQTRFYEGAYLLGVLAGQTTKTGTLGYVASIPIPEVIRNLNAFTLGARSVNPKATVRTVWVNAWYDPARERDAAQALINQGADVMYQNTSSPAVMQLAESRGVLAFGQDSDMAHFGPRAQLTANTLNWGVYYVHKVRQKLAGQWRSEDTKWGMQQGIVQLAALGPSVPPAAVPVFEQKKAAVQAGKLHPFAGPIADQAGKTVVPAGQAVPESELWTMKWYVEGIHGKQP